MHEPILITGESGAGKNHSLLYLNHAETFIMRATSKAPLPIGGVWKYYKEDTEETPGNTLLVTDPIYDDGGEWIPKFAGLLTYAISRGFKTFIVDDVQFLLLSIENRFKQSGEFKDQRKIYSIIKAYILSVINVAQAHSDKIQTIFLWQKASGTNKLVIPGTIFNEEIVPQGFFNIVLEAYTTMTGGHLFKVNGNGICKTPFGMFDTDDVPNDITLVLDRMENYFEDVDVLATLPRYKTAREQEEAQKKLKLEKMNASKAALASTSTANQSTTATKAAVPFGKAAVTK